MGRGEECWNAANGELADSYLRGWRETEWNVCGAKAARPFDSAGYTFGAVPCLSVCAQQYLHCEFDLRTVRPRAAGGSFMRVRSRGERYSISARGLGRCSRVFQRGAIAFDSAAPAEPQLVGADGIAAAGVPASERTYG